MKNIIASFTLLFVLLVAPLTVNAQTTTPRVEIRNNDRIVFIGGNLAERFQYFGYWEAMLHAKFPKLKLSVRNQGFTGDEVRFRPRSLDFGAPDQHLTDVKADVIFAFFGFSESFRGEAGLQTFSKELEQFITHTLSQKYNGSTTPRLVLISPIAHEKLNTRNFPDGTESNRNIALYTAAMGRAADAHQIPFINLFELTQKLYAQDNSYYTFNGVHLSDRGHKRFAPYFMSALFGSEPRWTTQTDSILREVQEKNFNYFHKYRAVNGYYIYGGRSRRDHGNPPYTDAYVIENERAKLVEMAEFVDGRIWKVANNEKVPAQVNYDATRKLYDVPTNFNTPVNILPPEEAKKHFQVADGYEVNLFASEVDFPELKNPVQFTFDSRGRLWVATMQSYPQYLPPNKPNDKLLIFEDTDGDGKADKMEVFADGLHLPTGFELGDGGAYVAQEPNLVFLKDTTGDGKADVRNILLGGFDSGDSHHAIGAFTWGPGGGLYLHEGTFHITQVETPRGTVRNAHGGVYRYDPTNGLFQTFVHYNFANPWGHAFNRWGQNFVADASGGANYFAAPFSTRAPEYYGQEDFGPFKFVYAEQMQQFLKKRVRPTSGCEFVSSRHFPPQAQGNFLLNNVIGFQGILQHTVKDAESGYAATEIEPLLFSADRNFRPVDLQFGPDGALYVVDWFNPLVGHMQHSLRDPNRDHSHGRIWRITYPSRPLVKPVDIEGGSIPQLLELLRTYEDRTRYRVRLKLREFPAADVAAAIEAWVDTLDPKDEETVHLKLEALWVCQHHNQYDGIGLKLLRELLASDDYRARAAAVRVVSFWRHDVPNVFELLRSAVQDVHPRVRLEAVRACSYFYEGEAAEVALLALHGEQDYYIEYALRHTIRRLEPSWRELVGSGRPFAEDNPQAIQYIIDRVATPDLINMARSELVFKQLLTRPGVVHQYRHEALMGLAELNGTDMVSELVDVVVRLDEAADEESEQVLTDYVHMFRMTEPAMLKMKRVELAKLHRSGKKSVTRQLATAAVIAADGSAENLWIQSLNNPSRFRTVLDTIPMIADDQVRETLYQRVAATISKLPSPLTEQIADVKGVSARFVRIQILGKQRVLTIAEVQVMSAGKNVALNKAAKQSTTDFAGVASRAVDGNTDGAYANGSQTHTSMQNNPFWEVDLGQEYPIDDVILWNRTENNGDFVSRMDGVAVTVMNGNRKKVFMSATHKGPNPSVKISVGGANPRVQIKRSAVNALSYISGHDVDAFHRLAPLVSDSVYRASAVTAIGRLTGSELPKEQVSILLTELIRYIESVPATSRTQTDVMDAIQLGKDLSGQLGREAAVSIRRRLADLAVDVIVIRPIPHRMIYDRPHIYIQAGKPVEIVFENVDIMPHNLIITTPGAREEVGILAELLGSTPQGFAKQFIPDTDKVLFATGMLQAGEQQRLQITAPTELGEYPFVCTFPGHWRTMFGTVHVVADISDIPLQATAPVKPHGDMPQRKFVRKWSTQDVLNAINLLESGRDFEAGRRLFTQVSCVACHAMKGTGGKLAPDLYDLQKKLADQKTDVAKIVDAMVAPSKEIEAKYRVQIVVTLDGKLHSGVVVFEDEKTLRLSANPLEKNVKVVEINKQDIDEREESKVSIMPEGLFNTMTRNEIFDLLAYIISGANPEHPAFRK
ncbi:MAG: c-type cytochrome [Planctomycetaceae bacterium]|jgi:putative membrane-bound dehydrogenase-like protein|nr:c-type cytochrome [Planctomycetaceae bacterium]